MYINKSSFGFEFLEEILTRETRAMGLIKFERHGKEVYNKKKKLFLKLNSNKNFILFVLFIWKASSNLI